MIYEWHLRHGELSRRQYILLKQHISLHIIFDIGVIFMWMVQQHEICYGYLNIYIYIYSLHAMKGIVMLYHIDVCLYDHIRVDGLDAPNVSQTNMAEDDNELL